MTGHVKVLLHATFREIAGKREFLERINSNSTVRQILEKLAKIYGKDFSKIIDSKTGEVSPEMLVMLNGKSIRTPDMELKDEDILVITIPVGGG